MDNKLSLHHNILYSCSYQKEESTEHFFPEHALGVMLSGESHYYPSEGTFVMQEGTIGLMRRNQLFKKFKKPALNGEPFKLISIFLDQDCLHQYVAENNIQKQNSYKGTPFVDLTGNVLLKGFLIHWFLMKTIPRNSPSKLLR